MAETMTVDEFIRRIDQRLMDARNCGNCKHFNRSEYACLNPRCRMSKEMTGVCPMRLCTNETDVCNFYEPQEEDNG